MVLMAVDHASYFIARVHPAETWAAPPPYYTDVAAFLTRWVTHLCAPGFFMVMGIGLVWFAESRRAAGWSSGRITRFFVTRGAILLIVQHLVENPAWLLGVVSVDPAVEALMPGLPGAGGGVMLAFGVLSALGVAMIVWGVGWRAPLWVILAVGLGALGLSQKMTPDLLAATEAIPTWKLLLFVPGRTGIVQNLYPWVVWLVPAAWGIALGRVFLREPNRVAIVAAQAALAVLGAFVLLRLIGAGDAHQPAEGIVGWLTVTKYPPGEAFFTLMLGLDMALLAAFSRWPVRWLAPLEVFGRAPFFFYLAHLWIFGALSWAFASGASFAVMYLVWAATMIALYPACAWYARFKFARPASSFWRML